MMKTVSIQTRVDSNLKKEAEDVLAAIGIDMTTAIRLFLKQTVNQRKIPFELIATETNFNPETLAAIQEAEAIANGTIKAKRYNSFGDALKDLDQENIYSAEKDSDYE